MSANDAVMRRAQRLAVRAARGDDLGHCTLGARGVRMHPTREGTLGISARPNTLKRELGNTSMRLQFGVVLGVTASVAIAAFQPAGQGAVGDLRAAAATLGIGLVADLMQLLESPRRLRDPAERAPASDDRRRHSAHGSRLANRGDHLLSIHQTNASGSPLAFA